MNTKKLGSVAWALAVACLFLVPSASRAEVDFGIRGGLYSDAEAGFIGGELLWDVTRQWYFNPNLEYVFVDNGDLFTVNLDFHYDFNTGSPFYVWAGGGPAIVFASACERCDDENDLGLNLLGGVGFGKGQALRPYIQGKILLSDETEAVLAVGIRFH
ncbi:MAG TPA: hypothetical protein VN493_15600 [Thermoanaerobaculia bacterium]|nr:hypothetical protein [Thermoanaerobaculia bacterium]